MYQLCKCVFNAYLSENPRAAKYMHKSAWFSTILMTEKCMTIGII